MGLGPLRVRLRRALRRLSRAKLSFAGFVVGISVFLVLWLLGRRPDFSGERATRRQVRDMQAAWAPVVAGGSGERRLWESVMEDVAIVVKTGSEVSRKRLGRLRRNGWLSLGRRVPNLLVVGEREGTGVIGIYRYGVELLANIMKDGEMPRAWFAKAGWRGDKDKNLPAFHLLRTVYPGKKWYVMIDDDTYFFVDNFAAFVLRHSAPEKMAWPLYTGKVFYFSGCEQWKKSGEPDPGKGGTEKAAFAHGGSGIVLNGLAMESIYGGVAECMHRFNSCWAGDMQVGLCLRERQITPRRYNATTYERHFHPFSPSKAMADKRYTQRWLRGDAGPITFHKLSEEEEVLVSAYVRAQDEHNALVLYTGLLSWLLQNGVKPSFSKNEKFNSHKFDVGHEHFIGVPSPVDTENFALARVDIAPEDMLPRF